MKLLPKLHTEMIRFTSPTFWRILNLILFFGIISLVNLYFTSTPSTLNMGVDPFYFVTRQFLSWVIGLGLFLIVGMSPNGIWKQWAYAPIAVVSLLLVIALFIPAGLRLQNLKTFSEWGPFAIILMGSCWLAKQKEAELRVRYLPLTIFFLIQMAFICLVFLQPDFTIAMIMILLVFIGLALAGMPLREIGWILLSGALLFGLFLLFSPISNARLNNYLAGIVSIQYAAYQLQMSLAYMAKGGLFGLGFGSTRFAGLPAAYTDSVFVTLVTHLGSLGTFFIMNLYGVLIFFGFQIAKNSQDRFNKLLACGLTSYLALEILINTMSITNLLPNNGNTLPLFSYGSMNLIITLVSLGLLVNIAKENTRTTDIQL